VNLVLFEEKPVAALSSTWQKKGEATTSRVGTIFADMRNETVNTPAVHLLNTKWKQLCFTFSQKHISIPVKLTKKWLADILQPIVLHQDLVWWYKRQKLCRNVRAQQFDAFSIFADVKISLHDRCCFSSNFSYDTIRYKIYPKRVPG